MDNAPARLTLEAMRTETDRMYDPEGVFQKVLYIESVMYEKLIDDYVRRQKR